MDLFQRLRDRSQERFDLFLLQQFPANPRGAAGVAQVSCQVPAEAVASGALGVLARSLALRVLVQHLVVQAAQVPGDDAYPVAGLRGKLLSAVDPRCD